MAEQWKHKRYFKQYNHETSSYVTFASTADAQTKIGFGECFNTNSPSKTYALADSNQTLIVTYEHSSDENQNSFNSAIDAAWTDGSIFTGNTSKTVDGKKIDVLRIRHVKTEWLYPNGSVSSNTDFTF